MILNQKNFDKLIESFNHKMTNIESDIKWMRYIGYYICGIITISAIGGLYGIL